MTLRRFEGAARRASVATDTLGGVTMRLFSQPETLTLIKELADADDLTIVVGAGASVEAGLPRWDDLVRQLLKIAAGELDIRGEGVDQFVDWVVAHEGLPASGAIAQAVLGRGFRGSLRRALYGSRSTYAWGQTDREIARLRLSPTGANRDLVTTNYDLLLERALVFEVERLRAAGVECADTITAVVSDDEPAVGEVLVRHLHGIVPPRGAIEGDVVLSDLDYHLMQDPSQWQEQYFRDRLETSNCLFVGTSLSDPNLVRYLSWAGHGGTHVVCFARQQDAQLYTDSEDVALAWETAAEDRWAALNVNALWGDFYCETAQFIYEIEACRRLRGDYVPLAERHETWAAAVKVIGAQHTPPRVRRWSREVPRHSPGNGGGNPR